MAAGGVFLRIAVLAALAAGALPALADVADEIAAEMRAQGYTSIEIERTLLGRIRVTGEAPGRRREVVIDRGTGEILRDLTEEEGSGLPSPARGHG